jgi:CheY-like chemotaxis protein
VSIRMHVDPGTPNVMADSSQIHQILMNLGTNALHAMGERGGAIDVSLTRVGIGEHESDALSGVSEGRYARVSLADSGTGIEPATLPRVFEPFFTTKPPGQGTGLGLSVVHGIMQAHNGAVTVQSSPGQGTTFHLYFPAADAAPEQLGATQTETSEGKGEHVLYVDDEEALVFLATRMLRRLGYQVTGLSDAAQALQEFRARPHAFDVVVTDTSMPGLSGLALTEQVRSIRPEVPVVLVSGYFRPEDLESAQRLGVKGVIFKPHSAQELSETIRRVIGRRDSNVSVRAKERPQ